MINKFSVNNFFYICGIRVDVSFNILVTIDCSGGPTVGPAGHWPTQFSIWPTQFISLSNVHNIVSACDMCLRARRHISHALTMLCTVTHKAYYHTITNTRVRMFVCVFIAYECV